MQSKYKYTVHSITTDTNNGKLETVVEKGKIDTVSIEYIKGAIKYVSPDKQESVLVKQGESDVYEFSSTNEIMKVLAPKGADTLKLDMSVTIGNNTSNIIIKLAKIH